MDATPSGVGAPVYTPYRMHVERVGSSRALEEFCKLGPDPMVPLSRRLDTEAEPFWEHAHRELFLLKDGFRPIGRIAAVIDRAHDERYGPGTGFFAWMHAPDDLVATRALVEAAIQWLRERGCTVLQGPLHIGLGQRLGAMIEGFDRGPSPLLPWNEQHLPRRLAEAGFSPVHEWHTYMWSREEVPPPPASLRYRSGRETTRGEFVYRPLDPTRLDQEVARFLATYNAGFEGRFDFVPLTEKEAQARLRDLARFADLRMVWLAEVDETPAGVVVAVPDVGALQIAAGPFAPLRALRAIRSALRSRRIERVHLVAVAVEPRFRPRHVGAHLVLRAWRAALDLGVKEAELSGVEADDAHMQNLLWRLGCRRVRRFQVFRR